MYRKPDPLYGAPRGNRVMAAKRTTGPSAQRTLCLHVALEKCSERGCENPVFVTRNISGTEKVRKCVVHLVSEPAQGGAVWNYPSIP